MSTLVFLHSHVSRDGAESDEAAKSTSVISVDCNENTAIMFHEKAELKNKGAKEVKHQSDPGTVQVEISKSKNSINGVNNNKKKDECELITTEEKSSTLNCSTTSVNITEVSQQSSISVCKTEASKLTGNDHNKSPCSSDEEDSPSGGNNNKESYAEIKSKRKTLLKIEKLTDSDSRSRNKMRRRALSPPSSSDEENLYIGWIAYPTSSTSFRRMRDKPRCRPTVWWKAAKFIFYPVTKVCEKCSKTKVEAVVADE